MTWTGDPATSQAVTWRTDRDVARAVAEIALAEDGPKFVDKAKQVAATSQELDAALGPAFYHTANFTGLQPKTKYVYRVGGGAHWSEWSHFTTAAREPEPFTFVYFGDAQNDIKPMWSRVVREAYADAPRAAFLLHAGDLVNNANSDAEWGEWFYAASHIHRTISCIATPGNHEYSDGALSKHCVLSVSLHDVNFRKCYPVRRQQPYLMRTTYEEPIEIEITGKACPWT